MIRSGIGFDAHRFGADRRLVLGGIEVADRNGLIGHSDADVLCHAVIDALLGAACCGNIGTRFPNTDPEWKDASSLRMLGTVAAEIAGKGFRITGVDSTVIAERPTLQPLFGAMRTALAGAAGIDPGRVSVKATTAEGMGALGRAEGIAAMAVVTLEREEHDG